MKTSGMLMAALFILVSCGKKIEDNKKQQGEPTINTLLDKRILSKKAFLSEVLDMNFLDNKALSRLDAEIELECDEVTCEILSRKK